MPAKSVDEILLANEDMLARIKLCYGADRETFERDVLPLIRRYAQYVHLLPATPDNYFADVGGLLRLGLEVGFYALQGTDGHIFSGRATISARKHLEPRWRHATFIAGLCCEIHLAIGRVSVTDIGGAQWTPYLTDLSHWLTEQHADRYFLKWLPGEGSPRALGLFALQHVVSTQTLQHLSSGNTVIVPHMLASVAGMPMYRSQGGEHNVLDDLVKRAFALVVDRNLRASADRLGRTQLGAHVERYLVDAMRRLVAGGAAWTPNMERSRLWFGADGLYMLWPQAAADICKLLDADQVPSIPKAPQTLAELLVASGVVQPRTSNDMVWPIAPPPSKAIMEALKLSVPSLLFAGLSREPVALPQSLAVVAPAAAVKDPVTVAAVSQAVEPAAPAAPAAHAMATVTAVADTTGTGEAAGADPDDGNALRDGQDAADERQLSLLDALTAPVVTSHAAAAVAPVATQAIAGVKPPVAPTPSSMRGKADSIDQSALHATTQPTFSLDAPMRLDPAVRSALAAAIASMNDGGIPSVVRACTVPSGVFVPVSEFERRGVEPPTAVRLLSELSMLATPGADPAARAAAHRSSSGKTVVRDFGGTEVIGVVVLPQFVKGLDPAYCASAVAAQGLTQPPTQVAEQASKKVVKRGKPC